MRCGLTDEMCSDTCAQQIVGTHAGLVDKLGHLKTPRAKLFDAIRWSNMQGALDGSAGTYAGLVEKLGYLKRLGVNAIELLPVQEFNELEYYAVTTWRHSSCL